MEDWEHVFLRKIIDLLKTEEALLSKIHREKLGYDVFEWGVATILENALVYLIYRELVKSRNFKKWYKVWEDNYPGDRIRKRVDLTLRKYKSKLTHYFEFKWYSSKGLNEDYKKLRKIKDKPKIGNLYILLFDARQIETKKSSLRQKIERTKIFSSGKVEWVINNGFPVKYFRLKRFTSYGSTKEGIFEVGFLKIIK